MSHRLHAACDWKIIVTAIKETRKEEPIHLVNGSATSKCPDYNVICPVDPGSIQGSHWPISLIHIDKEIHTYRIRASGSSYNLEIQ